MYIMSMLVTVFGATGLQGGAVARSLVSDNEKFKVRAVTRNPESPAAIRLKELGCEVVKGNFDEAENICECVEGAHACFLVTNYWEHMDKEREIKQGKGVVDACKKAGVGHLVYSGLESAQKLSGLDVPHLDGKGEVEDYIQSSGIEFTLVRVPFYFENFLGVSPPRKVSEHNYVINIPMGDHPLHGMSVEDIGPCVKTILIKPDIYKGKTLEPASAYLTIAQYGSVLSKNLSPNIFSDGKMSCESFEQLGFPGSDDLANMFRYNQMENNVRDLEQTRSLNPNVASFDDWVKANKERLQQSL